MSEIKLTGAIFYEEVQVNKWNPLGLKMQTRSESGQGWMLDINNLTPKDLRILANFLEQREKKTAS